MAETAEGLHAFPWQGKWGDDFKRWYGQATPEQRDAYRSWVRREAIPRSESWGNANLAWCEGFDWRDAMAKASEG